MNAEGQTDQIDDDLDQWIKDGLDAELAQMDAGFDFEAGITDVQARANPSGDVKRAACSCGWRGPWRHGHDAGWQATADADAHRTSGS